MIYKEYLRISRGIIWLSIVCALFLALTGYGRLTSHSPASTIDVEIGADAGTHSAQAAHHAVKHVHHAVHPGPHQPVIPWSLLFAIAGIVATIFAGIYGASLSNENQGHLEVAWTKPRSRSRYALIDMAADYAGATCAFALTLLTAVACLAIAGLVTNLFIDRDAWLNLVRFLVLPLAWLGLVQAATASLRERSGAVSGGLWVAAVALLGLEIADLPRMWHGVVAFLNFFNPLNYSGYRTDSSGHLAASIADLQADILALVLLGVAGILVALVQWRKLEA
ncbi:MAG: hypothetical protein ACR2KS_10880 [Candidatus Eremiobacter antarcticus]|nr:hypothetical protein [Candidatus Eremiobacteraeota bacterium]MBC5807545.1 hypothetical protein [Candidatus Eremiobacteraeota bacterium]